MLFHNPVLDWPTSGVQLCLCQDHELSRSHELIILILLLNLICSIRLRLQRSANKQHVLQLWNFLKRMLDDKKKPRSDGSMTDTPLC